MRELCCIWDLVHLLLQLGLVMALGSAAVTKSNTFLRVVAVSLTRCTSSNMIMFELLIRSRLLITLWYVLIVISRTSLRSPKYAPILSSGIPYLVSLSIFCRTRTIRGTTKRILNKLSSRVSAALLAHSNAISVLSVPVLYIIEPL